LQALQSSILNGPWFLEKTAKYGAIASGKYADLLLLDENPLLDIRATQKINAVVLKGKLLDRKALDDLLEATAKKNLQEKH
jgi:imidazolonepropionase-like amidohydrolase